MKKRIIVALPLLLSSFGLSGCGDGPGTVGVVVAALAGQPTVPAARETPPLHGYDDAPRAPDSDDPAIWVHPRDPGRSLFVGALKNAGLQVYDLGGGVVQTIAPSFRPAVAAEDPPPPGLSAGAADPGTSACPDSESGETFGRFNNVDILYGIEIALPRGRSRRADVAVVTDRGCDRLRIFAIEPGRSGGPLFEITSSRAGRVFPERFVQPSPFQPGSESRGVHPNPLDDQSTNYGLAAYDPPGGGAPRVFVTQRHRTVVAELALLSDGEGGITYRKVREFRFPAVFTVAAAAVAGGTGTIRWTPCRESPDEDPQLEGMVVDQQSGILYASQEVIGIWRIPLGDGGGPSIVNVTADHLIQRTRSFGVGYFAIPDGDEFECAASEGVPPDGTLVVAGNPAAAGADLVADVEGLAIYYARHRAGYLVASSQGDGSYHVYDRRDPRRHLASFRVEATDHTDGHDLTNVRLGRAFPHGLFVTQNGEAPPPPSTDPINGFDYDNSTQFKLVDWQQIAAPLGLVVDTEGYDPRHPR